MKQKTRWFIKTEGELTNKAVTDMLEKVGELTQGLEQKIMVGNKRVYVIEVPSYDVIKSLFGSTNNPDFKFKIYKMLPNARQAIQWMPPKTKKTLKLKKNTNSQAKA